MTIQSVVLGPGTLKFGTGGTTDASGQVTHCRLVPAENKTETTRDSIKVLTGETLAGATSSERSIAWTLEGTFVQDTGATSLTKYMYDNRLTIKDFEFIPNTAEGDSWDGEVNIVPLQVGGEVDERNTADFKFDVEGDPVPTWA